MLIQINKCTIFYIVLIIVSLFSFLVYFASIIVDSTEKDFNIELHPFIIYIFLSLCNFILAGIFLLFQYFQSTKTVVNPTHINDSQIRIPNIIDKYSHLKDKVKLILCVCFAAFAEKCGLLLGLIFLSDPNDSSLLNQFTLLQLIQCGLLSYPIIHYPLYNHHFLSIGLLVIGFFLTSFSYYNTITHWVIVIFIFLCYSCWSLSSLVTKWIMLNLHINALKYTFLLSLANLSILTILIIPLMYIPCNIYICSEGVVEPFVSTLKVVFSSGPIVLFLALKCSFYFVYNLMHNYLNEKTSPTHVSLAEILTNIIYWIYFTSTLGLDDTFTYSLIGNIVVILGATIYNEIIILKFCSLDKNTRREIIQRSQEEYNQIQELSMQLVDYNEINILNNL